MTEPQVVANLPDGTEVIKSRESRRKRRRWTYVADIQLVFPKKNEDGTVGQTELPVQRMRLESVTYSDVKDARAETKHQAESLRNVNPFFKNAIINVQAVPHETISNETFTQLNGYRDMAMILDKALELAIREAQSMVLGKSFGIKFMEKEANPPMMSDDGKTVITEGVPARTIVNIKEDFYKEAVDALKKRMEESDEGPTGVCGTSDADSRSESAAAPTDSIPESIPQDGEERQPFVPEIVEIKRAEPAPAGEEVI